MINTSKFNASLVIALKGADISLLAKDVKYIQSCSLWPGDSEKLLLGMNKAELKLHRKTKVTVIENTKKTCVLNAAAKCIVFTVEWARRWGTAAGPESMGLGPIPNPNMDPGLGRAAIRLESKHHRMGRRALGPGHRLGPS